jgi:micrococcal nuclease
MLREALAVATGLLVSCLVSAQEVTGRVIGVHDGDTFTILTADKQRVSVRLADIDAPELGQPFGRAAKGELSNLCFDQTVTVQTRAVDRYGRTVAMVSCDGNDAARLMVERGMAWAYRKYLKRPELVDLEKSARDAKVGLWADHAVPPWLFRRRPGSRRAARYFRRSAAQLVTLKVASWWDAASGPSLRAHS